MALIQNKRLKGAVTMLKAIGKYIDTMPVQKLLSQEEARADSVIIEVDRFHGDHDLADFLFIMRGITESGGEAETTLSKFVNDNTIRLTWEIGPAFTKEAGELALDLFAYRYEEMADSTVDAPDYLLRYQLPAIQVRGLPDGTHVLDEQSYTAFLLMIREITAQFIEDTSDIRSELKRVGSEADFHDTVIKDVLMPEIQTIRETLTDSIQSELERVASVADFHDTVLKNVLIPELQTIKERVTALEEKLVDYVKIVILTQSAYDALPEKEEATLYVVKEG